MVFSAASASLSERARDVFVFLVESVAVVRFEFLKMSVAKKRAKHLYATDDS
jgi:hypothetical protein